MSTTAAPASLPEGFDTLVGTGDQFKNVGTGFLSVMRFPVDLMRCDGWSPELLEAGEGGREDCWYAVNHKDMVDIRLFHGNDCEPTETPTPNPAGIDAPKAVIRTARPREPVWFIEIPEDTSKWIEVAGVIQETINEQVVIVLMAEKVRIAVGHLEFKAGNVIYRQPGRGWTHATDMGKFLQTFEEVDQ